ncbi:DNA recombination protein RmuC [Roseomonas xinghualingensis]|uniref:DNA recombination protein RmuC n=1 Tax=Roseomonas xinghualingensis TaxID=2986475 RepID=UPI0021F0A6C6|nr:DNA recombination protein RmuC [Roseomonas sp. SXEYE001]MCV4208140.1 DNA recombination protein RmuC [Roseomonas sp. SXEYE001]
MAEMTSFLPLILAGLALLGVAALMLRRPAESGGEAMAALSGKLDALGAAQDRQASAAADRAAAAERALADRLAEARMATDAALAAQRERLAATEQALADRLGEATRAMADALAAQGLAVANSTAAQNERLAASSLALTETLANALSAQNERLAAQEKALADRLASTQEALSAAVAAQNERIGRILNENAIKAEETAGKIHERLAVIDAARANMEALGAQVGSLAQILGNKQSRGAFGEVQLRQIVEDRLPPDGFVWQHTLANRTRCDVLIRLPHPPGPIAVDSKFPLEAWLAARDATDDATRLAASKRFAADVKRHVDDVAGKYICPGETADGTLIFVPSEAIYADLHAAYSSVVDEAARRGVYIVSPSTLWAVLGTMRALMQDVRMRAEAGQIKNQVAELMKDVTRLDDRVTKLRRHFIEMQRDVDQIEISTGKITRRGVAIEALELSDLPAISAPGDMLSPAAD